MTLRFVFALLFIAFLSSPAHAVVGQPRSLLQWGNAVNLRASVQSSGTAGNDKPHDDPVGHSAAGKGWTTHDAVAAFIFVSFALSLCSMIPVMIHLRRHFDTYHADDDATFKEFLEYRFTTWFTTQASAPATILLLLTIGLIVVGALLYSACVGESPSHALYRIFVIASASAAESEATVGGRVMGVFLTLAGLVILSILLSIVSEAFMAKKQEIKKGGNKVVEGGHTVILGYTECTKCLLEELASARESEGGSVFCLLAKGDKEEVEQALEGSDLHMRNSKVIVRTGNPYNLYDLLKANVDAAHQIVLLADTSVSREESDAKSVRTLLALKSKNWPLHGRIVVQCASESNRQLLEGVYDEKVQVVVVGEIIAKLMVQSSRQTGLAGVFGMMLGFEGDEFYTEQWPLLVGKTFREAVFRFPNAVALGVFTADGECKLNPGWDYEIEDGDEIIALAEDNDTYKAEEGPYFDYTNMPENPRIEIKDKRGRRPSKVIVFGWNYKIGTLLDTLDKALVKGSMVDIMSPRTPEERVLEVATLINRRGGNFESLTINQLHVDRDCTTARLELENLDHSKYDSIFVLADVELEGKEGADEKAVAILAQLQNINRELNLPTDKFDPVVEICEDSTIEHLRVCGFKNLIHSNSMVSSALASVCEDEKVNAICADLMSIEGNEFDIRCLEDFWPEEQQLPQELSFGEATFIVGNATDAVLVAWSEGQGEDLTWVMNPKDKRTKRRWTPEDRVVVIRAAPKPPEMSMSRQGSQLSRRGATLARGATLRPMHSRAGTMMGRRISGHKV